MASSSSKHYVREEGGEEYPYPSHVCAPNFVTLNMNGRYEYGIWKTQMLCLIESHCMLGFIDGTLVNPQTSSSTHGKEKVCDNQWRRSDALLKGWILGSLTNKTLRFVLDRIEEKQTALTAKILWDELQIIFGPTTLDKEEEEPMVDAHRDLYEGTLAGIIQKVKVIVVDKVTVIDKITSNGNTALHVAVATNQTPKFLEEMLGLVPENTQLSDLKNSDGSTILHVAAIVGNTDATKVMVTEYPHLLLVEDKEHHTPLAIALSNMHRETAKIMIEKVNTDELKDALFSGKSGNALLVTVISSKDFGLANDLWDSYKKKWNTDNVLMALAQNFPCEGNIVERYSDFYVEQINAIGRRATDILKSAFNSFRPVCCSWVNTIVSSFFRVILKIIVLSRLILWMLVWPFVKERHQIHKDAMKLLNKVCNSIRESSDPASHRQYYNNSVLEATRQNSYEVVHHIVNIFPNAILSSNEEGHNFIQYAVISRSEEVYNLLYQMSEHRNFYRTIRDSYGNTLLHLAARLAPINKLNLISGAALQLQREIQWFKEVEGFICPLNSIQKNNFDETPQMIFTREHKELVVEGEKWMKATAKSYTITAALIITIVFAAAITVPGGNNQATGENNQHSAGLPVFTNNTAFNVFAVSDAISLFASVTSLLMFLSILTARFAEQDFLCKLPTKLIIGSATLFISTASMVVAFGATLYLVFGQSNSTILIVIAVLTCIPITSFVTLQLPLIIDLMSATYGRSIFGKKRDQPFY